MARSDVDVWGNGSRPGRAGKWLIACAALAPVVPIVVGIVLLASTAVAPSAGSALRPLASAGPSRPASLVKSPHFGSTTVRQRRPEVRTGSEIALVTHATTIRAAPDGPTIAPQPTSTQFGSPVAYYVRQVQDGWLGVVSPLAGNDRLGWIPASAATISRVDWKIEISLARRQLTVLHGSTVVQRYEIAIGRPSAPTPTGTFAVTDRLLTGDPEGPYGCCILALSALAPHVIQDWSGGDRIAIHSTPPDTYWSLGEAISHGCMHVTLPEGQWLIDHIPVGTPTIISSD